MIPRFTMGDRLRKARAETGLNFREFARDLGVSADTVWNAEAEHHEPRESTLKAWADRCGVPVSWFREGEIPVAPYEAEINAVTETWVVPKGSPREHYARQDEVRERWLELAQAIDNLIAEADGKGRAGTSTIDIGGSGRLD